MTQQEVFRALQELGGEATTKQIEQHLNQKWTVQKALYCLRRWGLITARKGPDTNQKGARHYIYTIVSTRQK